MQREVASDSLHTARNGDVDKGRDIEFHEGGKLAGIRKFFERREER